MSDPLLLPNDLALWTYLFPLRALARRAPLGLVRLLEGPMALAYQVLEAERRRVINRRLAAVFDTETAEQLGQLATRILRNEARRSLDDLVLPRVGRRELLQTAQINGLEHLQRGLAAGKGVILATGHFFGNRAGKWALRQLGHPVLSLRDPTWLPPRTGRLGTRFLKPICNEVVHEVIQDEVLLHDRRRDLKVLGWLRRNGLIDVHIDTETSFHRVECRLLGRPWRVAAGYLKIAELTGAAIVPTLFLGSSRSLSIELCEVFEPVRTSSGALSVESSIARLLERLESWILRHPDQYEAWTWGNETWLDWGEREETRAP